MFPWKWSFAGDVESRRASDEIATRPSRGHGDTGSRYPTLALIGGLSEVSNGAQGDTWTHLNAMMMFDWRKPHDHDREIVAHDRLIGGSSKLAIATWTHDKPSIFIKRLSFEENVDCVVGHDSYGFAWLDGVDHIAKRTGQGDT